MARHIAWVVAVLLLVPGTARAAGLAGTCDRAQAAKQQGGGHPPAGATPEKDKPAERPKWWIDQKLRAELGITDQQSAAVDKIWQKNSPSLIKGRQELEKLEETLSQMTSSADEAAVIAQIGKVEDLRAELAKGRTLMIYRMNKLLTPEQRAKVKAMFERRDPRRGPSSDK